MAENKDYCEIHFTNAIIIDIFSRYASNSAMAEIVAEDGSINLRFRMANGTLEAPDTCERVLSLIYALFECNPDSTIGSIYVENQKGILRETVYRLSDVLDSFSDVKLTIHTFCVDSNDPNREIESTQNVILKRERKTETV